MPNYRTKLVIRDASEPDVRGRVHRPVEAESAQAAVQAATALAEAEGLLKEGRYVAESEAQEYTQP